MRKILTFALIGGLFATAAHADFTGKDASLATITFKNPGTCTSVVCVPIFSLFDPSGTNGAAVNTAGADGVSNTANGLLSYGRNLVFNGTTWDRWTGDLTNGAWVNVKASALPTGAATAAGVATVNTTLGSPMQNSGGSVTANIGTVGTLSTAANQTSQITQETAINTVIGAQADSVCGTATGTCTLQALIKYLNSQVIAATPAGTNLIGKVGIDQTTPGTTNGVQVNAALPAGTNLLGKATNNDGTNSQVLDPCQIVATVRTPISISTAANIKIVTGTSSKKTHICGMMLISAGTTNVGIVEGSGTNCATSPLGLIGGATAATGPNLTAQAGFVAPPAGYAIASTTVNANDICLINSAAIQVSGYVVTATP